MWTCVKPSTQRKFQAIPMCVLHSLKTISTCARIYTSYGRSIKVKTIHTQILGSCYSVIITYKYHKVSADLMCTVFGSTRDEAIWLWWFTSSEFKVFWSSGRPLLCFSRFWPFENVTFAQYAVFTLRTRGPKVCARKTSRQTQRVSAFLFWLHAKWSHYFIHHGASWRPGQNFIMFYEKRKV